jgi:hypothetical protein
MIWSVPIASIFEFSFFFFKKYGYKKHLCFLIKTQTIKACYEVKKMKILCLPSPPLPLSRDGDSDHFCTDDVQVFNFSPQVPLEFHNPISNCWVQMLIYHYLCFSVSLSVFTYLSHLKWFYIVADVKSVSQSVGQLIILSICPSYLCVLMALHTFLLPN